MGCIPDYDEQEIKLIKSVRKHTLEEVEKMIDELNEFEFLRVEPRGTKPTIYIIKKDLLDELQKLKEKK